MTEYQLFTVSLTDLGSYDVTVAAGTTKESETIARSILHDEAPALPEGLKLVKRESQAKAVVVDQQPLTTFCVRATYSLNFSLDLPAANRSAVEIHARRLYDAAMGPFEFSHDVDRVSCFTAREIAS